jgi:NAD(P)-dependent dehydrogenase (short-subunit alcohol dehydrogenase family)
MNDNHQMKGKVVLITGATSGIGKEAAVALAGMGATVVAVGRNQERATKAVEEIERRSGSRSVEPMLADLSQMSEVGRLAARFLRQHDALHVLINNAGFATKTRETTAEGVESQWAVNYLAPYLLTTRLLDCLKESASARIVNVSASAHAWGTLDFGDLEMARDYKGIKMYARTKTALNSFTFELARRLRDSRVSVNCLHPGVVRSNFPATALFPMAAVFRVFFTSPEKGARNTVYLASSPDVEGVTGEYYVGMRARLASEESRDPAKAERLFELTAKQIAGLERGSP